MERQMKRQLWLGVLGAGCLAVVISTGGCSGGSDGNPTASTPVDSVSSSPAAGTNQKPSLPAMLPSSASSQKMPTVPGLLQPTNAKARLPGIETGRPDPFAAVPGAVPIVISSKVPPAPKITAPSSAPLKASGATMSGAVPLLPPLPTASLPSLPNVPINGSAPLPPINIPVAPPAGAINSPTSLAEAIQVSGVVQVAGSGWNVIVKEPSSASSRYVKVGDYLENGRVLVKKIIAAGGAEPAVVLQQNGVEIRKSLG